MSHFSKEVHVLRKTGIVKDKRYLKHKAGFSHPESPERLASVYEILESPSCARHYVRIEPRAALPEEIAYVHTPHYIDFVSSTSGKSHVILDSDTITSADTYKIALLAAGGLLNAIDAVIAGDVDNAFAFVRPPGHHAGAGNSAGFCIFNNVAIGAMHARYRHNIKKVLIVDWDLHHGNGTQKMFYADRQVLYFSTHQYPYYPGTGSWQEVGEGMGLGFTVNVPLNRGAVNGTFVAALRKILLPIALAYQPELILASAGYDTYYKDPLGAMRVTPEGFAAMTRILMDIADECCGGKLVAVLEGGYHLGGLAQSARATLMEMRDETHMTDEQLLRLEGEADEANRQVLKKIVSVQRAYWDVF